MLILVKQPPRNVLEYVIGDIVNKALDALKLVARLWSGQQLMLEYLLIIVQRPLVHGLQLLQVHHHEVNDLCADRNRTVSLHHLLNHGLSSLRLLDALIYLLLDLLSVVQSH